MNASGRAILSTAILVALLTTGAAQIRLNAEPRPRTDLLAPAPGARQEVPAAPVIRQFGGQVVIGGGLIMDGGNVLFAADGRAEPVATVPDPAGPQVLDFTNGEWLHGTLDALDMAQGQLTWRRSDASGPLTLPLAQVNRLRFEGAPEKDMRPMATIKFTGGDWLAAEVTAIQGDEIQLLLADGSRLTTDRVHVEWIYFSKTGAAECYDGPTSLTGWSFAGGWTYRDGALRTTAPSPIKRTFQALPDRVEYRLTVDQGGLTNAFSLTLHGLSAAANRLGRGVVQLMMRTNTLHLMASIDGNFKSVQADLSSLTGTPAGFPKGPMIFRVFEDVPAGLLFVYINGRKAAEWTIDKGEAGTNGGLFQFQPMSVSGEKEQSLSNIRVIPWDGREPVEEEALTNDWVWLAGGEMKAGRVTSLDGRTLKLGPASVPRDQLTMLRFRRPANPPEDKAPVAHVRLQARGEFDAVELGWRDGKIVVRTNFAGEIPLAASAIANLDFHRAESKAPPPSDVLVFRNGDRLSGSLETTAATGRLRWQAGERGASVEFAPDNIASLIFAPREARLTNGTVARFRNGDWLAGTFLTLDREQLVLETAEAGQLSIPRTAVKALYFTTEGAPAVSDGASDHEVWERGMSLSSSTSPARNKPPAAGNPWIYAAGAYALKQASRPDINFSRSAGLQLGRMFDNLAPRVELSFTVVAQRAPVYFSAQLFTEPSNPGYMLNLSTTGLTIYDMNPRSSLRRGGIFQQQFPFGKEIKPNALQRHLRLLADRTSGRLTVLVDGVITAQITPRPSDSPRQLGRGVVIAPHSNFSGTFSNFWIGPWNGEIPGRGVATTAETVGLANGDEVQGTVEMATPSAMKLLSDVGPLDLPIERLTMVDFGGSSVERSAGTRLQLAGQGALTVSAWRIENEIVICRSEIAGELKLPLTLVQEIIFPTPPPPATAN